MNKQKDTKWKGQPSKQLNKKAKFMLEMVIKLKKGPRRLDRNENRIRSIEERLKKPMGQK